MAPACRFCGSVEGGLKRGTMAFACFLSGRELSPSSCPDARYYSSSLYDTGALQAATLVMLELKGSMSE